MPHEIVHDRTLQSTTLRGRECIERMTMGLIVSIAHLYENIYILLLRDDIYLSSGDGIVPVDYNIPERFKIAHCRLLSSITDRPS